MIYRAFRYRLDPMPEQEKLLWQFAGVTRLVYNLALEQRRTFWRQYQASTGGRLNFVSQGHQVTALRAEFPWIAAVQATVLTQALRDLDKAYAAFFAGRARFPTPRRRGRNDSFRFMGWETRTRQLNSKWAAIRIPKIGWVKYRRTRDFLGDLRSVTISHDGRSWHAIFECSIEHEAPANTLPAVGIDRGIANTIALSTGELLSTPDTSRLERRKSRAQRVLSRRKRGSNRYRKQRQRLSRITSKIARVRSDWRHKSTLSITQRFGTVALEDLRIPNMVKTNRGLSRSIHEQGWGAFERVLTYKLEERGGTLIKINPAFTSQECSACGVIDRASRESQASFTCRHCGSAIHADTNAAINILRRSTASMRAEGGGYAPDETRTINLAA